MPIAPPSATIGELVAQLKSTDVSARAAAAWSLAGAGDVESVTLQALIAAQDDASASVREATAWALGHVSSQGFDRTRLTETSPKAVALTKPRYPADAYGRQIQGEVLVDILISEQGRVSHAEIRKSIPALDAAALTCVREWRFEPGTRAGTPVPVAATAPVTFRIFRRPSGTERQQAELHQQ